jgi:hypothetical protein
MNNPHVIEEVANEETLVMICVDDDKQYGLLVDSNYAKDRLELKCDSLQEAREKAKSLL